MDGCIMDELTSVQIDGQVLDATELMDGWMMDGLMEKNMDGWMMMMMDGHALNGTG